MISPPTRNQEPTDVAKMTKDTTLRRKVHEEIAKFEKTMDELLLIRNVSKDLRSFRKMIRIKRYD